MFKKLDRYIIQKFLSTFIFSISLLIVIIISFDISEKLDDFMGKHGHKPSLEEIVFDYYINFIPYFISLFGPLFVFVSVIFFTSKMSSRTEVIAILSNGISFNRYLRPFIVVSVCITLFHVYLNNFTIPATNKVRLEFDHTYINDRHYNHDRHIHQQIEPNTFVYVESYSLNRNMGFKFSLEKFKNDKLTYKLMADFIKWDSINNTWHIEKPIIRNIKNMQETIIRKKSIDTVLSNFTPKNFSKRNDLVEEMNYFKLKEFIKQEKLKGMERVIFYEAEMIRRFAVPFASIILTLIAVALASRKTRGGMGMHLGIGFALSFIYVFLSKISTVFATHGSLPPELGLWLPNIFFTGVAFFLLKKAQK